MVIVLFFSRQIIMDDWQTYKCNPLITMSAEMFGHDSAKTSESCSQKVFKEQSLGMIDFTSKLAGSQITGLDALSGVMNDLTTMSKSLASQFTSSVNNTMSKMSNVASTMQYLIIKFQTIWQRLAATMLVITYSMNSMVQGIIGIQHDPTFRKSGDAIVSFAA